MAEKRAYFIEQYPDMLCVASFDGFLRDLNPNWEFTLGWSPAELMATSVFSRIHANDLENFRQKFSSLCSTNTKFYVGCRVHHKDGSDRYIFFSGKQSSDGTCIVLSARDKTEFRQETVDLATAKRHLEAIFSSMREGVVVQAASGEVVKFNPRALEILGLKSDRLMGKSPADSIWRAVDASGSPLAAESHPAFIAMATHKPQLDVQLGFHRPDGAIRWAHVSATPLFEDGASKPNQVLMTFQDVTDEKNARVMLEQKERELSRLINTIPALIAYWAADRTLIFANERYCDVRNRKSADIVGKDFRTVTGEEVFLQAEPYLEKALHGISSNFEIQVRYADGTVREMFSSYLPEFDGTQVIGFFSVTTDISHVKRLENERRDFESKFIAASKMSALGEMAAGIAHEINNPLAIINGKTSLLQQRIERDRYEPEKFLSDLKSINSTVERIAKTVRGLLLFARQSEQEEALPSSVKEIVETTLDLCREKLRNRGVELRLDLGADVNINCHSHQVSQILMNLLNNSNDAISEVEFPWIAVHVETSAGQVRIRVTDNGPGIPDEIAEKLMNPFFTTKEIGKGTGLGLSISKGLAESNGGSLYYDRAFIKTSFVLELPATPSEAFQPRKVG